MRAILTSLFFCVFLCSASAIAAAGAEPSAETIAHGKALTDAGDCASCHTADPQKPFAGGKRIDTPFGAIYSPNLTPDRETGIGAWTDEMQKQVLRTPRRLYCGSRIAGWGGKHDAVQMRSGAADVEQRQQRGAKRLLR